MAKTGRCACGDVTYRIRGASLFTQACHCADCPRTTGGEFVVRMVLAEQDFDIDGETRMAVVPSGSGAGCELQACANCMNYIWVRYGYHNVPLIVVRAGTLDDTSAVRPEAHTFARSKQPWGPLQMDVPTFEEACAREDAWPPECRDEYEALPPRT